MVGNAGDFVNPDIVDQYWRGDILCHFHPLTLQNQRELREDLGRFNNPEDGSPLVGYTIEDGMYTVTLARPGEPEEIWAQTDKEFDPESGFTAMRFMRMKINPDYDETDPESERVIPWTDPETGRHSYMTTFPGNKMTALDIHRSAGIVYGGDHRYGNLDDQYLQALAFKAQCDSGTDHRSSLAGVDEQIYGTSLGTGNAAVFNYALQRDARINNNTIRTTIFEPVGGGLAVRRGSTLFDAQHADLSREQIANMMSASVYSMRTDDQNFSHRRGNDYINDNAPIGTVLSVRTTDVPGTLTQIFRNDEIHDHTHGVMTGVLAYGDQAISHTGVNSDVEALMDGGGVFEGPEKTASNREADLFKSAALFTAGVTSDGFNAAAGGPDGFMEMIMEFLKHLFEVFVKDVPTLGQNVVHNPTPSTPQPATVGAEA